MRRILRDTTAIAVGLSLGLPSFASANALPAADATLPGNAAPTIKLAQADAPVVVVPGEAGATATDAAPAAKAAGDSVDAAVKAAEDAANAAADAAREAAKAAEQQAAEAVKPKEAEQKPAAEKEPAPVDAAKAEADAARQAVEAADKPAAEPKAQAEPAPKEQAQQEAAPVVPVEEEPAKAAAEPKAEAVKAPEQKAADTGADSTDAARKAAEAAEQGGGGAVVAAPAPGKDDQPAAKGPTPTAESGAAQTDADIARALAERESGAAAKAEPALKDAAGAAPVVTPAPSTAEATAPAEQVTATEAAERDALAEALAGAKTIPEAEARETDAAREAATATAVPEAAALAESAAPVVTSSKTEVTEGNSRAATEDFSTDLTGQIRDAVAAATAEAGGTAATGQTGEAVVVGENNDDDDDDKSDLERAMGVVLPALAGMAVGNMLSNNREVALNTGDRVIVTRADGSQEVIKDDNALLFRPGSTVQTEEYADGSSRTIVTRADGSQVVTIRDADLRVLRRSVVYPDGTSTALIDETAGVQPVDIASLPRAAEPVVVLPGEQVSDEALREALRRETDVGRSFTLGQIRSIPEVRALVAPVDIQAITFDTGSAAIRADQAQALSSLGRVIAEQIKENPREMFLIEGHTDTVGQDAMNLALSDRRAESVALALTEFFNVPPENMVVQGYGEQFLKLPQEGDVRANRRAAVRRITDLLAQK